MNVASELLRIERACGRSVGLAEKAEVALMALAMANVTGSEAIRIVATVSADMAEALNARLRATYNRASDYTSPEEWADLRNRTAVVAALRALAADAEAAMSRAAA